MKLPRPGIRWRLALIYSGLFAAGLSVFCAVLFQYFRRTQLEAFDSALYNFTVDISGTLEIDFVGRLFIVDPSVEDVNKAFPFHLGNIVFEIRDTHGRALMGSAALAGRHLPLAADAPQTLARDQANFETIDARALGLKTASREMRLITYRAHHAGWREPLILQVAAPLDVALRERRDLALFFWLGIPLFLMLAALAGVILSKRALKPVHDMTLKARGITGVEGLRERIPVPRANDEIRELAQTFNDLLNRLEGAFASQDRFVANASHQLRTPLTILKGELELLRKAPGQTDEVAHGLASAAGEIDRLIHLVQDLLLLARLGGGRDSFAMSRLRPDEILVKVVARLQRVARDRGVRLKTRFASTVEDDELGGEVMGDEELIESMIENFVDNAIKYSPDGSTVEVGLSTTATAIEVTVVDDGPGIPPAARQKIFERFTRGQPSALEPGSGLGLAIAGEIAKLHGVTIDLAAGAAGRGTRVGLMFPRAGAGA